MLDTSVDAVSPCRQDAGVVHFVVSALRPVLPRTQNVFLLEFGLGWGTAFSPVLLLLWRHQGK